MRHYADEVGLTFKGLREANLARQKQYFKEGGLYRDTWNPADWLQALVGEIGEYANFRKKFQRGDFGREVFTVHARKELADVQTYLDLLANCLGIDLGRATIAKFNEVSERTGSSIRLNSHGYHDLTLTQSPAPVPRVAYNETVLVPLLKDGDVF